MRSTLKTTFAVVAAAATIAAPAASARPIDSGPTRPVDVAPPPSSSAASAGKEYAALRAQHAPAAPQPVVDEPDRGGFDWLSAAVGAIAGLSTLSVVALGVRGTAARRPASA
jgi:hypothetical protein